MAINVPVSDVEAILISGEWFNVHTVSVDYAEYTAGVTGRFARGLHVRATIQGGPHNGDVLVVPLGRIDAVRVD